ncbi:LysR family transcriptional regulator [Vibrio diazotrophicus]|uniref:LysR family transcriptional regulator n=1 Tax=Vibrio diazotrophicus TaxID=685 RepID=UPI00142D32FC|nr:LysR family transcriptional regulator [Vibrio diazotrophicus]NIY92337.1 LysR family transcriptional regulator [Vibrio diazotrophicus]
MDKLEAMRIFVEVAKESSFVAASRTLNISAPAVTRSINHLETVLGVRLLNRTTRIVRLTDSGMRFFEDAKRILEDVDSAISSVAGKYSEPSGVLSITAPVLFGQIHITPILTEYLRKNSLVTVRAEFFDRNSNMLEEGLDVAIRIGKLSDSSSYATQVGHVQKVVCASPSYLDKHGVPKHPSDLENHEIVQASMVEASTTWVFNSAGREENTKVTPRLYCSQNGTALAAVENGLGITRLMSYQVGEQLKKGSLIRILNEYEPSPLPVNILYLERRHSNAKVSSFIELAKMRLSESLK